MGLSSFCKAPALMKVVSRTPLIVAALTLLAAGLRLSGIGESLFGDELFLWSAVHDRALGDVIGTVRETEKTPPLGFLLGWALARGDDADVLIRLPSLIASVATVPLIAVLGARTVGRWAGLFAAAWLAISPFHVFYGSETRSYALVTCFVVLSTLALVLALEDRRRRWWVLYAVAAAAAVYSHYIAVTVLVPQALWVLWKHREQWKHQIAATGLAVLAFAPWLPSFLEQAGNSGDEARRIELMSPLTVSNFADTWVRGFLGHPYDPLAEQPGTAVVVLLVGGVVALALALVFGGASVRAPDRPVPRYVGLLSLGAAAAPVVIVLYSLLPDRSFLLARNLIVSVPYAVLLLGWAITLLKPRVAAMAAGAALAVLAVGTVRTVAPERDRADARSAARWVDSNAPAGATLVDFPGPHGIRVYLQPSRRVVTAGEFGPEDWAAASRSGTPVYVSYLDVGGAKDNSAPPQAQAVGYSFVEERVFPGSPGAVAVRVFAPRR